MTAKSKATVGTTERRRAARGPHVAAPGIIYVLPTWLLMLAVGIVPVGFGVWMSITSQSLTSLKPAFVGLQNFRSAVLTEGFLTSLGITGMFVLGGLVVQFAFGFALALALHRQLRGFRIARSILLVPMLLTPVVVGLIFKFLYSPELGFVGLATDVTGLNLPWFSNAWLARLFIVVIDSWMHIPFVMLLLVAGLASMPAEPIEAAQVDGANARQRIQYVVLPLIAPVVMITILLRGIEVARLFDVIATSTQGGPGRSTATVSLLAYDTTFRAFEPGQGAAIALALVLIMSPVYALYLRMTRI